MAHGRKKKPAGKREPIRNVKPRHAPDARIDKAQQAWAERRYDDAIRLYERALERQPTNAVLLVDVARAYALRFRYAEAEQVMERARRLYPNDAQLQRMLGATLIQIQQFDRAIECFRRSLELSPNSPERARILYELARMHERLHQLDDARMCAEESLALAPEQPVLRYLLAVIDRRAGNKAEAVAQLQDLTSKRSAPPEVLADAWYQMASIRDGEGEFAAAFEAVMQAKRILNNLAGPMRYDAADIAAASQRTYRTITADHFERWQTAACELEPLEGRLALLTSHPRSGTTLLEQVLDAHPQLISADEIQVMPEVVYVPLCEGSPTDTPAPSVFDAKSTAEINARRRAYWAAMEGALREKIGNRTLLDKNPALTGLLPLVGRVFPEMRIIFALRDPRDVVLSCFLQQLPLNPVSIHYLSIEDTAREYAATMRLWLKLREIIRNPWLEVRYEETVHDLPRQARRTLEFLELRWDDAVLDYRRRAEQKHVHSPTYEAVTRPLYTSSISRWKNYAAQLEPCMNMLKPYIEAFGYEG